MRKVFVLRAPVSSMNRSPELFLRLRSRERPGLEYRDRIPGAFVVAFSAAALLWLLLAWAAVAALNAAA
jgi:hypothetical protein